jgi:hypothetical protein
MTENDIKGNVAAIRELASGIAGAECDPREREAIKTLVTCSLVLLESLLLDANRIANALEGLANIDAARFNRDS